MYAIIDIETTGGSHRHEKITEIAIIQHNGSEVTAEYSTLVNPEKVIPGFITGITGITNEMVMDAPRFFEIANEILEFTDGRIIVAHNAKFDYSFIREEFRSLGYNYRRELIDTVSASRKLMPGLPSYSLGALCTSLGITNSASHRAAGDAHATVKLFEILLERDKMNNGTGGSVLAGKRELFLPPQLNPDTFSRIPEEAGVYYFRNLAGDIIYIGKSRNLHQRVTSHFHNRTTRRAIEMTSQIADIDWIITGSELIALLRESEEIKREKPLYNRRQRRNSPTWGLFKGLSVEGYVTFSINRVLKDSEPLGSFRNKEEAVREMNRLLEKFRLCQKLAGLYDSPGVCFHHQIGLCRGACAGVEGYDEYNIRAEEAILECGFSEESLLIIDRGRDESERSVIKVEKGRYCGYGYFDIGLPNGGLDELHDCIGKGHDDRESRAIIKSFLRNNRVEKIIKL